MDDAPQQFPSQLAEHWQTLGLTAGSPLDEVEAAYSQLRFELARAGEKQKLAQLKVAYQALVEYFDSQSESEPEPLSESDRFARAFAGLTAIREEEQPVAPRERLAALNEALGDRGWQAMEMRQRKGEWQILLDVRQVPKPAIATATVALALQDLEWEKPQRVRIVALRSQQDKWSAVWNRQVQLPGPVQRQRHDRFEYDNPLTNALALPVAALVAWFLIVTGFSELLLGFRIWVHEFGHATVAWLRGYRALPLPFGWTSYIPERSLFVYFGVLILLALLFWAARREKLRWLQGFAILAALLQFYMTWQAPESLFEQLMSFCGVGGEFYLSALMLVGFYFRLPDRWRWDFYRYPVLVLAAITFWKNFWRWHLIEIGQAGIPFGTLLGGEGDASGDMNRLLDWYGWSAQRIVNSYSTLGDICLLAILATYVIFLIKFDPHRWFRWQHRVVLWLGGER